MLFIKGDLEKFAKDGAFEILCKQPLFAEYEDKEKMKENLKTFYGVLKNTDGEIRSAQMPRNVLSGVKGYPKGLDTENMELLKITPEYFVIRSCGDWQDAVNIMYGIKDNKLAIIGLYESCEGQKGLKKILELISSAFKATVKKSTDVSSFYKELKKALDNSKKLEYFKNKILQHLDKLEKVENKDKENLKKSLLVMEKSGYPVGTIREWKGKKFIKIAPGKWKPKYDSNTRGAKLALAALKRKISECTDSTELMKLVLENRDRFSDNNGRPLPFVRELSDYVNELNDKIEQKKQENNEQAKKDNGNNTKEKDQIRNLISEYSKEEQKEKLETLAERGGTRGKLARQILKEDYDETVKQKFSDNAIARRNIKKETRKTTVKDFSEIEKQMKEKGYTTEFQRRNDITQKTNSFDQVRIYCKDGYDSKGSKSTIKKVVMTKDAFEKAKQDKIYFHNLLGGYVGNIIDNLVQEKPSSVVIVKKMDSENKDNVQEENTKNVLSISDKYKAANIIEGDDDSITLPDGTELEGTWKLMEADTPTASHDESTFSKTEGFPTNEDGTTINDRDYEHDNAAKEAVLDIASDYDSRALSLDNPVVVSEDGVVISGNNRTMSSKLAAKKGTDKKYIDALNKKCKKFGFTQDDIAKFKNPRVVFETNVDGNYSTSQFAKFNQSDKKAQSPVEIAIKVSKTIDANTVESVASKMSEYDTLGELYADNKAMQDIFNSLIENKVIQKTDLPAYYTTEGGATNNGKEFLETVLIGSVINESNIRALSSPGGKEIRQKLVRAIVPLVENKGMKGYSITNEINEAVNIAVDIKKNKKFENVEEYAKQNVLFGEKPDPVAIEFAKRLEGTQKEFAEFMKSINGGLKPAANGEADIFLGGIESRDEILNRYLNIKKSVWEILNSITA